MSNKNTPICGCGLVLDLPKSRMSTTELPTRNLTILIPKASKNTRSEGQAPKTPSRENRGSNNGSSSSIADHIPAPKTSSKHRKRLNSSRRNRSAERSDSHYTYIDSDVNIGGRREDTIPEALYCTIEDPPLHASINGNSANQVDMSSRSQPVYAIPSMTSPPPTYDVAIAKTWQSGLPPSYEEYLCHKYAMLARSHTPPPPWSDSVPTNQQTRRELLASQPELREYLARQGLTPENVELVPYHYVYQEPINFNQGLRKQANITRTRARPLPPRSHSESRVQNSRACVPNMYEDGTFCMETTAIQSAFDNDVSFCSVM